MDPLLSICIPTLSGGEYLDRLLASIERHTSHIDHEIIIVHGGGRKRGYTRPANQAASAARGTFLAILNDDVEVSAGWFEALSAPLDKLDVWCTTPDATATDGPQIFAPYCMLWKARIWISLDEQFILWCSDIDLARRMVDAGHPPVRVLLENPIRHALNATTGLHPDLGPVCVADLARFRAKWGVDAETEKHRLAALTATR